MLDPRDLVDVTFGPHPLHVSAQSVADFVGATGDDPVAHAEIAPPGYLAVALFVVAPALLGQLDGQSVIHGEQSFSWRRPITVGATLSVRGRVTRARERSGVFFTSFEIEVTDDDGVLASGSSLFLISGDSAPATSAEEPEPAQDDRGDVSSGPFSASRADLVRYAAATRDWNPIHWDHQAAVSAGLPGVVVHGLLQASWALRAASVFSGKPIVDARIRFRNPLRPATPVSIACDRSGSTVGVSLFDGALEYISARVECADG